MRTAGYTLIELLAVVVILGLAAGIGIPSLARMVDGDPLERTRRALQTADQQARSAALGAGLEVELAADGLRAQGVPGMETASGISLTWRTPDGATLRRLGIDHRGRSVDLQVEIRREQRVRHFIVSGISGEWSELRPAQPGKAATP